MFFIEKYPNKIVPISVDAPNATNCSLFSLFSFSQLGWKGEKACPRLLRSLSFLKEPSDNAEVRVS